MFFLLSLLRQLRSDAEVRALAVLQLALSPSCPAPLGTSACAGQLTRSVHRHVSEGAVSQPVAGPFRRPGVPSPETCVCALMSMVVRLYENHLAPGLTGAVREGLTTCIFAPTARGTCLMTACVVASRSGVTTLQSLILSELVV